jgi:predicted MFS family arabinose efflux permease
MGPLVLIATGSAGLVPFLATASIVILASLPLFRVASGSTYAEERTPPTLWRIFRLVPHIMLLNLTYAATAEAFSAFFPLFGIHIGLGETRSLSLLAMLGVGGLILQLPLGWLADHVHRQALLISCILLTIAGFIVLPEVIGWRIGGPVIVFVLGGVEGMIYVMGVILLGQRFRGAELASASVLYTSMWGAGTMLGPAITGAGMDLLGDASLPYLIAAFYAAFVPVYWLLYRSDRLTQ